MQSLVKQASSESSKFGRHPFGCWPLTLSHVTPCRTQSRGHRLPINHRHECKREVGQFLWATLHDGRCSGRRDRSRLHIQIEFIRPFLRT